MDEWYEDRERIDYYLLGRIVYLSTYFYKSLFELELDIIAL